MGLGSNTWVITSIFHILYGWWAACFMGLVCSRQTFYFCMKCVPSSLYPSVVAGKPSLSSSSTNFGELPHLTVFTSRSASSISFLCLFEHFFEYYYFPVPYTWPILVHSAFWGSFRRLVRSSVPRVSCRFSGAFCTPRNMAGPTGIMR